MVAIVYPHFAFFWIVFALWLFGSNHEFQDFVIFAPSHFWPMEEWRFAVRDWNAWFDCGGAASQEPNSFSAAQTFRTS